MTKKLVLSASFMAALSMVQPVHAATLVVGPGMLFDTIASAAAAAQDGDTILIQAGSYSQGAIFRANGLTIASTGGAVTVRDGTVNGQGLFVIKGNDTTIDGIRFENAVVPDANGAGIRHEGANLTVLNSYFTGTQNGILDTSLDAANSQLIIRGSTFEDATSASGFTHAVYVTNPVQQLVVETSTFLDNGRGHAIKSRALSTIVRGNVIDDEDALASYMVESARGGRLVVEANRLVRQVSAENNTMVAFGAEASQPQNPNDFAYVGDNEVINTNPNAILFNNSFGAVSRPAELHENAVTNTAPGFILGTDTFFETTDADPFRAYFDDDLFTFHALEKDGAVSVDLTDQRFDGPITLTQVTLGLGDLFPESVVLELTGPAHAAQISLSTLASSFAGTQRLSATASSDGWLNIYEIDLSGGVYTSFTLTDTTLDTFGADYADRFDTFGFRLGDAAFNTAALSSVTLPEPATLALLGLGLAALGAGRQRRS